jgi:pyruvate,water dikinase
MTLVVPFTTGDKPELVQVGGKASSLIVMTQQGIRVPHGFVLTVAFFQPWLDQIQATPEWARALGSTPDDLEQNCQAVKALCLDLELDATRQEALAHAVASLATTNGLSTFAVRSSSPEEDLEELSFAGGYETVLGVREEDLEDAVRRAFASAFDDRVLLYKQEYHLPVEQPRIAVIVQQQIGAETAGVAFSLNPLNNCYDEIVINANFGLGGSVVSGLVSPDSFVVDKGTHSILERKLGEKETSVWLSPDGGTRQEPSSNRSHFCLSDEQVIEVTAMVQRVEGYYRMPMDIEWAFADGVLYLLQARPITAYVPLPEELLTAPGERKRLYLDLTLVKWGMHDPLSVMGMDYLDLSNIAMLKITMGQGIGPDTVEQLRPTLGGRVYGNVSNSLKMQGMKRVISSFRVMDTGTADILEAIDLEEYVAEKLPPAMRGLMFRMIGNNLGTLWQALQALRNPARFKQRYLQAEDQLRQDLARQADEGQGISTREYAGRMMDTMIDYINAFFALLLASEIAKSGLKRLFKDEEPKIRQQVIYLERALPNNITVEMGLAMHRLSGHEEVRRCASREEFVHRLEKREFSPEFLQAWDTFMEAYGFRTPMEMDPAKLRFYEQPGQLFEQLQAMAQGSDTKNNAQAIFEQARAQRERAYESLLHVAQQKGKRTAKKFKKNYNILLEYGGYREKPKYFYVLITDMLRRRVLAAGRSLVYQGRLDQAQQAFDLHMDELDRGLADPNLDLRMLAQRNSQALKRVRHVHDFPRVIDSRGRILRPPKKEAGQGELAGEPISPGVAQGKVKVLHQPDEKPVLPGEILVTRATDPGWTPLFLNAAGIVLEVGGMLQHGALVAREYGKPCVSGLVDATKVLLDGQVVEVDGGNGIVRFKREIQHESETIAPGS